MQRCTVHVAEMRLCGNKQTTTRIVGTAIKQNSAFAPSCPLNQTDVKEKNDRANDASAQSPCLLFVDINEHQSSVAIKTRRAA